MTEPTPTADDALRLHLLVLRCQAGDERAFAQLMGRFGDRTLRYLRGLLGDGADDVQQEVWLTVYRRIATLTDPRRFRTWLYQTTRHRAIDHLRAARREDELFVVDDEAIDLAAAEGDAEPPDADALDRLIDRLAPVHREALLLRYRDDLGYAEIAVVAGCSIGTIRSRIHYATQRLRELNDDLPTGRRTRDVTTTRGIQ